MNALTSTAKKTQAQHQDANGLVSRREVASTRSVAGFLLMDSSLNPISFNAEAIQILSYPDKPPKQKRTELFLGEKVRSTLLASHPLTETPYVPEFRSGRRRYFCRAFLVHGYGKGLLYPGVALLLERGPSGLIPLSQISQQFSLTHREGEALTYLLQGLSSKEIAGRMNVSPNTVKAFLRLTMIKTGVSSRSALIAKIIMAQP